MLEFFRKYRHVLTGLLLLLITLQIPIYRKQDRSLSLPAKIFYTLAYYPQNGWDLITDGIRGVLEHYVFLVHVAGENERLNEENAQLRGRLFELQESAAENERLRKLLDMRQRNDYAAIGAKVIALDASNWFRSFTINAGSVDGLDTGMPVVTDEGLVGTVVSVAPLSSKILPVVDLNSSIPVVSQRTRARGMVVGRGSKAPKLNFLERAEDVREGDLLVTSGLGGAFPAGVPVATVSSVKKKSYGLFQEAELETIVRFGRVENVAVLRYLPKDEIPPFVAPMTEAADAVSGETLVVDATQEEPAPPAPRAEPKPIAKPKPAPKPVRVVSEEEEPAPSLGDRSLPVIPAAMPAIPKPAVKPSEPAVREEAADEEPERRRTVSTNPASNAETPNAAGESPRPSAPAPAATKPQPEAAVRPANAPATSPTVPRGRMRPAAVQSKPAAPATAPTPTTEATR